MAGRVLLLLKPLCPATGGPDQDRRRIHTGSAVSMDRRWRAHSFGKSEWSNAYWGKHRGYWPSGSRFRSFHHIGHHVGGRRASQRDSRCDSDRPGAFGYWHSQGRLPAHSCPRHMGSGASGAAVPVAAFGPGHPGGNRRQLRRNARRPGQSALRTRCRLEDGLRQCGPDEQGHRGGCGRDINRPGSHRCRRS